MLGHPSTNFSQILNQHSAEWNLKMIKYKNIWKLCNKLMVKMGSSCVESSEDDVEIRVRVHSMREDLIVVSYTTNKNKENSCVITYFGYLYIPWASYCFLICNIFVDWRSRYRMHTILSTWFDRSQKKVRHTEATSYILFYYFWTSRALMAPRPRRDHLNVSRAVDPEQFQLFHLKYGKVWLNPIISLLARVSCGIIKIGSGQSGAQSYLN